VHRDGTSRSGVVERRESVVKKLLILVAIVGIAAFAFSKMGSKEPEI
jgi:hypothetical protein